MKEKPILRETPLYSYISKLNNRRSLMKSYLQLKVDEEDFHGVQDAASDLRDIDSALAAIKMVVENG